LWEVGSEARRKAGKPLVDFIERCSQCGNFGIVAFYRRRANGSDQLLI